MSNLSVSQIGAGVFRPPTATEDSLFGQGSPAKPRNVSYGTTEGSPVWKNDGTMLPSSTRLSTPFGEPTQEQSRWTASAPYICEFIGTFMLVFTAATCNFAASKQWTPTAIGCVLVVIIYAVGFVSGGHLNPAVTLAVFLAKKISAFEAACYIVVQVFAGLFAGFIFEFAFLSQTSMVAPGPTFHFTQVAIFEVLYTALLCFVWLNVSSSVRNNPEKDKNQFFALAIGFTVIAAGYAGGNISGSVLNPALALGLDLPGWWRIGGVMWGILYALVELAGAALGAGLFRLCREEDYLEPRLSDGPFIDDVASYVPPLRVRIFSEFLGSFFLVLTFGLNVIMLSTATAWSVSAALLCLVYALGNVSGAHFNPAVTAAVVMSGRNKCSAKDGLYYALVQCLGGVMASLLMSYMHNNGPTAKVQFGLFGITSAFSWSAIATVEILFTFLLTYVVLAVATSEEYTASNGRSRQNFYFALAIGFAMCAGCVASGPVSGGYLNPAVALGFAAEGLPDLTTQATVKGWPAFGDVILKGISLVCKFFGYFGHWMLYLLFELAGAALAAVTFRLTHPAEYHKRMPHLVTYVEHPTSEQ